jgi:hypothetical protein
MVGLLTFPILNTFPSFFSLEQWYVIENKMSLNDIGITAAGTVADLHGIPF